MLPPADSQTVSNLLRQHDIYITASRHDPCSNSLIEALTCGLPVIFLRSGGHPEIVNEAGLGFDTPEEIPELIKQVVDHYVSFQQKINVQSLGEVTQEYLRTLELL